MKTEQQIKNKIKEVKKAIKIAYQGKFMAESDKKAIESETTENALRGYKEALKWVLEESDN